MKKRPKPTCGNCANLDSPMDEGGFVDDDSIGRCSVSIPECVEDTLAYHKVTHSARIIDRDHDARECVCYEWAGGDE